MLTLAAAIEIVEQLPIDQQDLLVEIIRQRQFERRRDEVAQNGHEALDSLSLLSAIGDRQKLGDGRIA